LCLKKYLGLLIILFLSGCTKEYLIRGGRASARAEQCGHCHIEIFEEWKQSAHARSFISKEFKEITYNYRFKKCLGCHVPVTIFSHDGPEPRDYLIEEGVTCVSCHLLRDKLHGPLNIPNPIPPHPVGENDQFYRTSDLCGKCHGKVFREWKKWAEKRVIKKTCQDCHMPMIRRRLIQDIPWRWIQPFHDTKGHNFTTKSIERSGGIVRLSIPHLNVSWKKISGSVLVENIGAGHSIPAGDYGYREAVLLILLKDALGITLKRKDLSFFQEMDNPLRPGEKHLIHFEFEDPFHVAKILEVSLILRSYDSRKPRFIARIQEEIRR